MEESICELESLSLHLLTLVATGDWSIRSSGRSCAQQTDHHALDDELGGGQQVGIAGIFGTKKRVPSIDEETFQRGFAVNQGGDDVARAGLTWSKKHGVPLDDIGVDHRIAAHAQGEEFGIGPDAERGGVDAHIAIRFLFGGGRQAGRDGPIKRDVRQRTALRVEIRDQTAGLTIETLQRALGREGIEMALHPERAREPEVRLNFSEGRSDPMLTMVAVDEIEDLLLPIGEGFVHGVQVNTCADKSNFAFSKP